MAKNEKSSKGLGTLASRILSGDKAPTVQDAKRLAGGVLTQRPDRKKGK